MSIARALIPEVQHETGLTRQLLALVPDAKADWKPHPRSMSLGSLAVHMVECFQWGADTLKSTEYDMAPVGGQAYQPPAFTSAAAAVATLERNAAAFVAALETATDADMMVEWSFKKAGSILFAMPRIAVLRGMILNHLIHHRGQLTVYLRLRDIALPSTYGPTADLPM